MTNINCSSNCKYQKDGNCCFESVTATTMSKDNECAYFSGKDAEKPIEISRRDMI